MEGGNKMKRSHILLILVLVTASVCAPPALAQDPIPSISTVVPDTARIGDVLVVEGHNLGSNVVDILYLTDNQTDWRMEIVEQSDTTIRFRVPDSTKPGRHFLMLHTPGGADKPPQLLVQPVKVTVET